METLTEDEDALLFSEEEEDESANDVLVDGLDIVDNEFVFTWALGQSFAEIEQCVVDRGSIWEFKVELGCATSVAKPSSFIELSDVLIDGFTKLPNPFAAKEHIFVPTNAAPVPSVPHSQVELCVCLLLLLFLVIMTTSYPFRCSWFA